MAENYARGGYTTSETHAQQHLASITLKLGPGYDYLGDRPAETVGGALLRAFALTVLAPVEKAVFGLEIHGRENAKKVQKDGAVAVANHVHILDCTFCAYALWDRRQYFLAMPQSFQIPFVRRLVKRLGGVPIPTKIGELREMSKALGDAIARGDVVQIYPEAELEAYCDELRPFKLGAFRMAVESNAPVLPMVITFRAPTGAMKLYKKKPCVRLDVLEPLYPRPGAPKREEAERLRRETFARMERAINRIHKEEARRADVQDL